jgi:NAD(P)H-dependent FMN reductase
LVRALACHARGRGFESRHSRRSRIDRETADGRPEGMIDLRIIIGSVREGRAGLPVARWFEGVAEADTRFDVTVIDLAELALPPVSELELPGTRKYDNDRTKQLSALVEPADAYALVAPEYNAGPAPALKNAFDLLYHEWRYKPVGFVSYGGVSGGMRGVQALKPNLLSFSMMPVPEGVVIPFVGSMIEDGVFHPTEPVAQGAASLLDSLARWAEALRVMRED